MRIYIYDLKFRTPYIESYEVEKETEKQYRLKKDSRIQHLGESYSHRSVINKSEKQISLSLIGAQKGLFQILTDRVKNLELQVSYLSGQAFDLAAEIKKQTAAIDPDEVNDQLFG